MLNQYFYLMVTGSIMTEEKNKSKFGSTLNSVRISKATTVIIVTVALLLDNMLLTVIFPIIPEFLQNTIWKPKKKYVKTQGNLDGTNISS